MTNSIVKISQDIETGVSRVYHKTATIRYAYARSYDSQVSNLPGQDYLEFRVGESSAGNLKIVFSICDGVGSSFMGHLAAERLGTHLCEKLWGKWQDVVHFSSVEKQLTESLQEFTSEVTEEVDKYDLGEELPSLLRNALEKQRDYGSETMFVCGRLLNDTLIFAWLGDMRLQLLDIDHQPISGYEVVPDTSCRWSSREGIRGGNIQTLQLKRHEDLQKVRHILAFSDGLASTEHTLSRMSDEEINAEIDRLVHTPTSDDISMLHITLS